MLAIKNIFSQLQRKIALVMLAGLILLFSLPTDSVEAAGYYSVKDHQAEIGRPYYTNKERRIGRTEATTPYYSTKDRQRIKTTGDYIESGKRAGEVNPKELGTGKRQKNPASLSKRAGEEF